jgi:hypothetical protein
MTQENIFLKDGTLFARGFIRVVHGGRGDYVEFEKENIIIPLLSLYNNDISKQTQFYYYWLYPVGHREIKVYFQQRVVKYADYKTGLYYVSPDLFSNFKDPEKIF